MKPDDLVSRNARLAPSVSAIIQERGRAHIPGFLSHDVANELLAAMRDLRWKLAINGQKNAYDLDPRELESLAPEKREGLLATIHAQAREGFQFMFESYRVSDEYERGELRAGPLADFFATLNHETTLGLLRSLTADDRIVYADAQATRYKPGHFLTKHDDGVEGKNRLFAYVLNLSPSWRADWGGLLMFHDADGHVSEAFTPRFGALNILRVPQPHAVSYVTPFAGADRYSITGWFRSAPP
jgi:Rps23 Pro-64 3,4-dihydroxylase Tpa1-like proline 4-hydroxylase